LAFKVRPASPGALSLGPAAPSQPRPGGTAARATSMLFWAAQSDGPSYREALTSSAAAATGPY
jgi:hypothetical protein